MRTFVDPCPIELGRDAALMAEIAEKSEMNVVCTTGFYFEAMGLPVYWRARTTEEIAELYIREITHGIGTTGVRAGAIKVATGAPAITPLERKFLDAACIAQRATGVPIITHTQDGVCGPEQAQAFGEGGVEAHRCLIGHCCGNPDPAYHRRVVETGAYIGFDRIGILRLQPDEVRADNLVRLVRAGFRRARDDEPGSALRLARQDGAPDVAGGAGAYRPAQGGGRLAAALHLHVHRFRADAERTGPARRGDLFHPARKIRAASSPARRCRPPAPTGFRADGGGLRGVNR